MQSFGIRFQICNKAQLQALWLVYDRIRVCKTTNAWPDKKEYWMSFFDAEALKHFWWPTSQELEDWKKRYFSTPVPQRYSDPKLDSPWDFMSMFEAFKNGDYDLDPIKNFLNKKPFSHLTRINILTAAPNAWLSS